MKKVTVLLAELSSALAIDVVNGHDEAFEIRGVMLPGGVLAAHATRSFPNM